MMLSGRVTDKLLFATLYLILGVVAVRGAGLITNYALDVRFYQDFLMPWRASLLTMRHQAPAGHGYDGEDPMRYMQTLIRHLQDHGIAYPSSNTDHPFVYRLGKFGERPQQILMVFGRNRLNLYGLPASTFDRLDRLIDRHSDPDGGDLTGRWSTDQVSRIAQWKL